MATNEAEVLENALALPLKQRARVAASLIDSLDHAVDEGVESAWREEVARRVRALDEGTARTIPWMEARKEILR